MGFFNRDVKATIEETKKIEKALSTKEEAIKIFRFVDKEKNFGVEFFPTSFIGFNLVFGGGLPRGRIIEIFGKESTGKSTLCLNLIADIQREGGNALYVDVEHALDKEYAKKIGVDFETLFFTQPDTGESALDIVRQNLKIMDIIVIDSVTALLPRAMLRGEIGDAFMAAQARLMSQSLNILKGEVAAHKTIVIFTNQVRMNMRGENYTTGGNALKFYASVRASLWTAKADIVWDGSKEDGVAQQNKTHIDCIKNKVGIPFAKTTLSNVFGIGFCKYASLYITAVNLKVFEVKGAGWTTFNGESLGQGSDQVSEWLKKDNNFDIVAKKCVEVYNNNSDLNAGVDKEDFKKAKEKSRKKDLGNPTKDMIIELKDEAEKNDNIKNENACGL